MGFRFRKSVGLGKLARVNLSKSGLGLSVGVRGARVNLPSRGKPNATIGIPGTGLYYQTPIADNVPKAGSSSARFWSWFAIGWVVASFTAGPLFILFLILLGMILP
jgi:hypothetical protein